MTAAFSNNAFLHPIRAVKLALRRWLIQRDANAALLAKEEVLPPALQTFQTGESVPLKGHWFKVLKIHGEPIPAIILVPVGLTKGAKLRGLRNMRDVGRQAIEERKRTARAVRKEAR
jgi:hypothetical protein